MIYKLKPNKNQQEFLELIVELESFGNRFESIKIESIEFVPLCDWCLEEHFKVIGYYYINLPGGGIEDKSSGTRYYYKTKNSLVYDSLYKWMNPYIRHFKIEELLDEENR